VPLIVAVVLLPTRVSPVGNVPLLTVHVKRPRPPLTERIWLYGVPWFPFGSDVGLMTGAG
jgi:hypothetical protein